MKRSFLFLPVALAFPLAYVVQQAAFAAPAPTTVPAPAAPAKPLIPLHQTAPIYSNGQRVVPRPAPGMAPGHDHEGEEDEVNDGKPKDPVGDSLDYLWKQSDVAFHAGDYPTAIRIHRAIVTLDPTDTESYSVAAWLLWSLGQKQQGNDFIAQGLKANPKNPEMWNVAGNHYDIQKLFTQAKNAYMKAVQLSGKKPDEMLRRRLAHAAEHAGDLELSEAAWTSLVRDYPNSAVDKNNLARVKSLRVKA